MAGTTLKRHDHVLGLPESATRDLVIQFNKAIDDLELIRAAVTATCVKLDLDGGVTDTNYAAQATVVLMDTAAEMLAAKIGNAAGTAISA
jgi:hypothetical protein